MEFLNKEGVQILWSKVKDKVSSINKESVGLNNVTNDAQVKRSEMGAANGVPTLDSNGKIPVDQLGNLDTVVSMVVTELPTTDIKTNKIYLVKDSTTEGDLYQEYLYVDNKWEKVGTHKQEVDLTDYAKKSEALRAVGSTLTNDLVQLNVIAVDGTQSDVNITKATRELAGVMSAVDKNKLDGIADGANKYTLPIASATALGGIKLGSGLSATSDGTVSVSADVVAGSVQWDSIKNKPNVAILGTDYEDMDNVNSGCIILQSEGSTDGSAVIGYDYIESKYFMSVKQENESDSNNTYISADGVQISYNDKNDDHNYNNIKISSNGIKLTTGEGIPHNCVFMTDGTTQGLTAITTDELNEILV